LAEYRALLTEYRALLSAVHMLGRLNNRKDKFSGCEMSQNIGLCWQKECGSLLVKYRALLTELKGSFVSGRTAKTDLSNVEYPRLYGVILEKQGSFRRRCVFFAGYTAVLVEYMALLTYAIHAAAFTCANSDSVFGKRYGSFERK